MTVDNSIIIFDKFLGYKIGGAQHSFHYLLKNLSGNLRFIGCEVKKSFSAQKYKIKEFPVERLDIKEVSKLPYLEYWLNKRRISRFFSGRKGGFLFTQSLWAPLAINNFKGKTVYFVRDEYNLNRIPNYYSGFKFWLKKLYILSQYPFINQFFSDNQKAIKKADLIIANSYFVADEIKKIFGRKAEIIYPLIDVIELKKQTMPPISERPFITAIGSEFIKGREIVEKIARAMPDHKFMIVGREFNRGIIKKNILYQPWSKNIAEIYGKTKILLAPSIINEAFCRVAVEGMSLGIPCLGSRRGGIPEVLEEEYLIKDVWNIQKWIEKIKEIENNYQDYSKILKEKVMKFDAGKQITNFKKIAKEKLNLEL